MGEVGVPPALEAAVESLREAVSAGRTDIVRRLLDACDNCDGGGTEERKQLINSQCTDDGDTFLHIATKLGHGDIVRALLAAGGDPGVVNASGDTPPQVATSPKMSAIYTEELLRATAQSDLGRVCQLLAGGLSVNSYDNAVSRNTPLHWAASFANTDTLHCLIVRGADVKSVNSDGATPLHDAVARGNAPVVQALLEHGAFTNQQCVAGRHKGMTPMQLAMERGGPIVELLKQYDGDDKPKELRQHRRRNSCVGRFSPDLQVLAGSLESVNSVGLENDQGLNTICDQSQYSTLAQTKSVQTEEHQISSSRRGSLVNGFLGPSERHSEELKGYVDLTESTTFRSRFEHNPKDEVAFDKAKSCRSPLPSTSSLELSPNLEQVCQRLSNCMKTGPPIPLVTNPQLHQLWPQPRRMTQLAHHLWVVPRELVFSLLPSADVAFNSMCEVVDVYRNQLEASCGIATVTLCGEVEQHTADVTCSILPILASSTPLQYSLAITSTGVRITCGSLTALHSAMTTFVQLLYLHVYAALGNDHFSSEDNIANLNKASQSKIKAESSGSLLRQSSLPQHLSKRTKLSPPLARSNSELSWNSKVLGSAQVALSSKESDRVKSSETCVQIEGVVISDSPEVPHRAFMLDVAPLARIPTLTALQQMIDSLVLLKINQLHLIMRIMPPSSTFSTNIEANFTNGIGIDRHRRTSLLTNGYPPSNRDSSSLNGSFQEHQKIDFQVSCPLPYQAHEIISLARYCERRGMSLIPAFDLDSSWQSTQIAAQSINSITSSVAHALLFFPVPAFVSIGPSLTSILSSSACTSGAVSNPWYHLGILPERTALIVCANVFLESGNAHYLRGYLPSNAILMEYGFQADYSFRKIIELATVEGRPAAVCPGTAAWSSLAGFPEAGICNVFNACSEGAGDSTLAPFSRGLVVIAHWSTPASLTPLIFMWPAVVVGAGLAWNSQTHWDYVNSSIGSLIDLHLVGISDCGFGNALVELGRCETWLTREMRGQDSNNQCNLPPTSTGPGSTLHQLLADPDSVVLDYLTPEKFGSVLRHIKRNLRSIVNNKVVLSTWPQMPVAASELNLTADLMMTACRLGRSLVLVGSNPHSNLGMAVVNPGLVHLPPTFRTDLANRLLSLRESYNCLWLHCHQSAGLQASLLLLSSLLARLLLHHDNIHTF